MHALHGTKPNRTKPNHFICPTLALTLHSQCGCCKFRFFSMFRFLFDAQAVDVGIYRYGRLLFYTQNFSILIVYCIVLYCVELKYGHEIWGFVKRLWCDIVADILNVHTNYCHLDDFSIHLRSSTANFGQFNHHITNVCLIPVEWRCCSLD